MKIKGDVEESSRGKRKNEMTGTGRNRIHRSETGEGGESIPDSRIVHNKLRFCGCKESKIVLLWSGIEKSISELLQKT